MDKTQQNSKCKLCCDRDEISKVKLATIVEGNPKAPFSIATTPKCRGGRHSFPGKRRNNQSYNKRMLQINSERVYDEIRGSLNKFPDFFRMGTFIDSMHMKL